MVVLDVVAFIKSSYTEHGCRRKDDSRQDCYMS